VRRRHLELPTDRPRPGREARVMAASVRATP
jgi:hypothetical protein